MAQRVLITAGASGIGREMARAFVANGAKVFVCDIDRLASPNWQSELPGPAYRPLRHLPGASRSSIWWRTRRRLWAASTS